MSSLRQYESQYNLKRDKLNAEKSITMQGSRKERWQIPTVWFRSGQWTLSCVQYLLSNARSRPLPCIYLPHSLGPYQFLLVPEIMYYTVNIEKETNLKIMKL